MKYFNLITLFAFISCGRVENTVSSSRIGEIRTVQSASRLSSTDQSNLQIICDALTRVQAVLPSAVNSTHSFLATQADCTGKKIEEGTVSVVIQAASSGFVFRRQDGLDFLFPKFETSSQGELSTICTALGGSPTNPIFSSDGSATFFSTIGLSSDCPYVTGESCVLIEKAVPDGELSYRITSREWIRFRLDPRIAKTGFFSFRRKVAQSYCPQGQSIKFEATLK